MAWTKEQRKEYDRKYRISHKEERRIYNLRSQRKYLESPLNRLKLSARNAVYHAVKTGKLIKPNRCDNCGARGYVEADHADYNKKLEVLWLCINCHYAIAKKRSSRI